MRTNARPAHGLVAAILLALIASCDANDSGAPSGPGDVAVRFVVANQLLAPVTIAIDDTVSVILSNGKSSGMAVAPSAQWLTWSSAKAADPNGVAIPDDIGQVKIRISGIRFTLEITNIIDDGAYITAEFFNQTNVQAAIGVFNGSSVLCATVLRAAAGNVLGFAKIGYYHLLPATEIRAYRDPTSCTGPYVAWPHSQLADFTPKSGLVTLTLNAAP